MICSSQERPRLIILDCPQAAGNPGALAGGVALGYATADTDAGHNIYGHPSETSLSSKSWSLTSPGNVNLHQLQTFGYRALEELTLIAKAVTKTYYNKDIAYSYWQGCSTGGRQGLTLVRAIWALILLYDGF